MSRYLDEEGLQVVANKVNTRLKTVTEMPASADEGVVRLYVGSDTENYKKGHTYQYALIHVPYYAWRWEDGSGGNPFYTYTLSETPQEGDLCYDSDRIKMEWKVASFDSANNTITDTDNYEYVRDTTQDLPEEFGWKDLTISDGITPVYEDYPDGFNNNDVVIYASEEDGYEFLKGHLYRFTTNGKPNLYAYGYNQYFLCKDRYPTSESKLYNPDGTELECYSKRFESNAFIIVFEEGGVETYYWRNWDHDITNNYWTDITNVSFKVVEYDTGYGSVGENIYYVGSNDGQFIKGHLYTCTGSEMWYAWRYEHHPDQYNYIYTYDPNPQAGDSTTDGSEISDVSVNPDTGEVTRIDINSYWWDRYDKNDFPHPIWEDITVENIKTFELINTGTSQEPEIDWIESVAQIRAHSSSSEPNSFFLLHGGPYTASSGGSSYHYNYFGSYCNAKLGGSYSAPITDIFTVYAGDTLHILSYDNNSHYWTHKETKLGSEVTYIKDYQNVPLPYNDGEYAIYIGAAHGRWRPGQIYSSWRGDWNISSDSVLVNDTYILSSSQNHQLGLELMESNPAVILANNNTGTGLPCGLYVPDSEPDNSKPQTYKYLFKSTNNEDIRLSQSTLAENVNCYFKWNMLWYYDTLILDNGYYTPSFFKGDSFYHIDPSATSTVNTSTMDMPILQLSGGGSGGSEDISTEVLPESTFVWFTEYSPYDKTTLNDTPSGNGENFHIYQYTSGRVTDYYTYVGGWILLGTLSDEPGGPYYTVYDEFTVELFLLIAEENSVDKQARDVAAGAMALAQQAIDNVGPTSFSTSEQDTGKTWIDGKKIYRQCWDLTLTSYTDSSSRRVHTSSVLKSGVTFISAIGGMYAALQNNSGTPVHTNWFPITNLVVGTGMIENCNAGCGLTPSGDLTVSVVSNVGLDWSEAYAKVWIEYTK